MMKSSNLVHSSANESDTVSYSHDGDHEDQDQEESGWTAYFDDYFSNKSLHPASKHTNHTYEDDDDAVGGGSMCCSPSTVSDAASCADGWRNQYKADDERRRRAETLAACSWFDGTQMVIHNKLRFKPVNNRRKRLGDFFDDSLEDTASSPVNSPKAKGDCGYGHQQGHYELKQQVEDANRVLEKKGLCLVPYSMLTNYID